MIKRNNQNNHAQPNSPIIFKVKKAISDFGMLQCSTLLVGFSGGADSCAMLDILHTLCKEQNISLYALHVNHMIRGDEALRDECFCKEFCNKRDIPIAVAVKDIPALAIEMGMGIEECARHFRYKCFDSFCKDNKIERIATAHNANDNTETVLFNLSRGSGIRGLCGIPPVRDNIIRPLIYCQKKEIIEYCQQKGIEYMQDSTNDLTDYTRNYIRHNITPEIEHINPRAVSAITRSSLILRQDLDALDEMAQQHENSDITTLCSLPRAIVSRVLMLKYKKAGFDPAALEEKHINSLYSLFTTGKTGDRISLPCKSEGVKTKEGIDFRNTVRGSVEKIEGHFPLSYGVNIIPELNCRIEIRNSNDFFEKIENVYKMSMNGEVFFDTIDWSDSVYCRAKLDGDRYRFGGMTRSVKKLLWEKGIPPECRINYPVICDRNGILLLPGYPAREELKGTKGEKYIINITIF